MVKSQTASTKQQNKPNKRGRPLIQRQSKVAAKERLNSSKNQGNTASLVNYEEEVSCAHDGNSMSDDSEPGTASSKQ